MNPVLSVNNGLSTKVANIGKSITSINYLIPDRFFMTEWTFESNASRHILAMYRGLWISSLPFRYLHVEYTDVKTTSQRLKCELIPQFISCIPIDQSLPVGTVLEYRFKTGNHPEYLLARHFSPTPPCNGSICIGWLDSGTELTFKSTVVEDNSDHKRPAILVHNNIMIQPVNLLPILSSEEYLKQPNSIFELVKNNSIASGPNRIRISSNGLITIQQLFDLTASVIEKTLNAWREELVDQIGQITDRNVIVESNVSMNIGEQTCSYKLLLPGTTLIHLPYAFATETDLHSPEKEKFTRISIFDDRIKSTCILVATYNGTPIEFAKSMLKSIDHFESLTKKFNCPV